MRDFKRWGQGTGDRGGEGSDVAVGKRPLVIDPTADRRGTGSEVGPRKISLVHAPTPEDVARAPNRSQLEVRQPTVDEPTKAPPPGEWLTLAWTAKGDDKQIAAASKEFLQMLVGIAMAALSALGAKANYGTALRIASSMPTGGLPELAFAGGGQVGGANAGAGVATSAGPFGPLGVTGAMMTKHGNDGNETKSSEQAEPSTQQRQEVEPAKEPTQPVAGEPKDKTHSEHARERGAQGRRTGPAFGDAQRARQADVYVQPDGRYVVRGPRGREHIFEPDGTHVTSIDRSPRHTRAR